FNPKKKTCSNCANCIKPACSAKHAAHHVAQTLTNVTWPKKSFSVVIFFALSKVGKEKLGAGLLMRGDGISLGCKRKPRHSKARMHTKIISGKLKRNLFMLPLVASTGGHAALCPPYVKHLYF